MPKEEEKTQSNLEIACRIRKNIFYIELVQKEAHKNYLGKKNNFYIEFVDSNVYMIKQLSFAIFCLSWLNMIKQLVFHIKVAGSFTLN